MLKRLFDIVVSGCLLLFLLPLFIIIAVWIKSGSKGPVFFRQVRVGKDNMDFRIWKFRTMYTNSEKHGQLTVGGRDQRITPEGYILRKYKMDELPQLINVLSGSMSIVGPRPEVRRYVDMYTQQQRQVLKIKPGITDYASIEYSNENELLAKSSNPEYTYITEVMPAKLLLNLKYINEMSLLTDLKIIIQTISKIFMNR